MEKVRYKGMDYAPVRGPAARAILPAPGGGYKRKSGCDANSRAERVKNYVRRPRRRRSGAGRLLRPCFQLPKFVQHEAAMMNFVFDQME